MPNESNVSCQSSCTIIANVPINVTTDPKMPVKPLL